MQEKKMNVAGFFTRINWLRLLSFLLVAVFTSSSWAQSEDEDATTLQKSTKLEIIDSVLTAFEQHYVYPDTARRA